MICPKCRSEYYFLKARSLEDGARCLKCKYLGAAQMPSYENYHAENYSVKSYKRTPQTDPQMRGILKKLRIKPTDVVIDLGCGVGDYTRVLHGLTKHAAGYDLDISSAQSKYPGVPFFQIDFSKALPLPDSSVDQALAINSIEHLADWDFFLKECRRVMKPGALIALSTANLDFILHRTNYDPTHLHEWNLAGFAAVVGKYFDIREAREDCAMFNYYPLNLLLRWILKPDLTIIAQKH